MQYTEGMPIFTEGVSAPPTPRKYLRRRWRDQVHYRPLPRLPDKQTTLRNYIDQLTDENTRQVRALIFQSMADLIEEFEQEASTWWTDLTEPGKAHHVGLLLYHHVKADILQTNPAASLSITTVYTLSSAIRFAVQGLLPNENALGAVDDTSHYHEACTIAQLLITQAMQSAEQFTQNAEYLPGDLLRFLRTALD